MAALTSSQVQVLLQSAFPDREVPVIEEVGEQSVLVRLPVDNRHSRPGGTVSGPTMMMLADTAGYVAVLSQVGNLLLAVTTSLHIDFLRKPAMTDLMARGRLLKLGKKLAVIDVELFSQFETDLVAKAQVTYSLPSSTNA